MKTKTELINERLIAFKEILSSCALCPRKCSINRNENTGPCGGKAKTIKVASWAAHRGEEPPISGVRGSGTIFASGCTMRCFYCQNFPFSQLNNGTELTAEELGIIISKLCQKKVHNINFVTPTHVVPQLLESLLYATEDATKIPLLYNTSGYENTEIIQFLEGIVDIYLPDIKYSNNQVAKELSGIDNYVQINRNAIKTMYAQVGNLSFDQNDIATKGLLIRHLILPDNLAGTLDSFEWLKSELGTEVHLSVMSQYFPAYKAFNHPKMNRKITNKEYVNALNIIEKLGFTNVFAQDPTVAGGA